jgi:arylformamidase
MTVIGRLVVLVVIACCFVNSALSATGPKVTHAYGPNASQILDSYSPPGSGHPILIYTHGGSWHLGSKNNQVDNKKQGLIGSRDYVLVSVEYRKGFETNWQGQANDIASAINWVYLNAAAIGGDTRNIFVVGHSSGAHMTALVSMDDGFGVREKVKGIVLLDSGNYDVVDGYNTCTGESCDAYGPFWDNYSLISMANGSPVTHADDNTVAPTILIHRNTLSKLNQANLLNSAIQAGGQTVVEQYGTNDSHEAINTNIGAVGYSYSTQVSNFLDGLVVTPVPTGC